MLPPRSIVVLDFGGQYAHLIASRIRRFGYAAQICEVAVPARELAQAAGIILSGGPQSVYQPGSPQADHGILELGVPILGICYGHQWLAHALGGEVRPGKVREYGHTPIEVVGENLLFQGLPKRFVVWMSHGDDVIELPEGFTPVARSADCANAAVADERRHFYGVQFHLEVTHTEHGLDILRTFVELCAPQHWSLKNYAKHVGEEVRRAVGDRKVFVLVSGGVDSTVAFTLLNRVLGAEHVYGLLIDTGLLRKGEVQQIRSAFWELGIRNLEVEDASEEFFVGLKGVVDPEQKRRVIGDTFLAVQRRVSEARQLTPEQGWMLGQGTIYPDTIETGGTMHADRIKTHHNRVAAIQEMIGRGLVLEPLKELYKDEVRRLGEELGLPHELVWRHPFPGPGLGVRILCAEGEARSEPGSVPSIGVPHIVLPVRSVGVQGDARTYRHVVVLFSHSHEVPEEAYWRLAISIPNTHHQFNRVVFCLSRSEPKPLVVTPRNVTRERADLLREADAIVREEVHRAGLYQSLWQFPVILLPTGSQRGGQSIVLRPVESTEAMTARAAVLPKAPLQRMTERLMELPGIDLVFYDLTHKPPGTIEWE